MQFVSVSKIFVTFVKEPEKWSHHKASDMAHQEQQQIEINVTSASSYQNDGNVF